MAIFLSFSRKNRGNKCNYFSAVHTRRLPYGSPYDQKFNFQISNSNLRTPNYTIGKYFCTFVNQYHQYEWDKLGKKYCFNMFFRPYLPGIIDYSDLLVLSNPRSLWPKVEDLDSE